MAAFIFRRILYGIPVILGTTLLLFLIFNLVPGDPVLQIAGKHVTPEIYATIKHELGLDKPLYAQYFDWIKQLVTLDFGRSYATKQRIIDMIAEGAGTSLSLLVPPFFISMFASLGLGILIAYYRGSIIDKSVVAISVGMQSVSALVYVLAGQYFLAFKMNAFPISGYDPSFDGRWAYLTLPMIVYILLSLAPDIRFYRTIFLDELYQDYVRTARSKGLSDTLVLFRHVLKNAMIPIITNLFLSLPFLILGALLIESFFSIPGLGDLTVRAIANADRPVLITVTVLGSVIYVIFNIIADILYAVFDPRVQLK
ncbi:MAG: ABC transporter permease [Bdellovibrionales bacterium]|nr:ABC transporter permease [Bdellovibrionales bacterium]